MSDDYLAEMGAESAELPTLMLRVLAAKLKTAPEREIKTVNIFKKVLGLKAQRWSRYISPSFLERVVGRQKWDHQLDTKRTLDDDIVLFSAPYHWWNDKDVAAVEALGGYVVKVHPGWGFWHPICRPVAVIFPASAAMKLTR